MLAHPPMKLTLDAESVNPSTDPGYFHTNTCRTRVFLFRPGGLPGPSSASVDRRTGRRPNYSGCTSAA